MINERTHILIFFEGPHLAYSPTTIQLYDELIKYYDVTILAQNPDNYNGKRISHRNVLYYKYYGVKTRHLYRLLFNLLAIFNKKILLFKKLKLNYRDYFFRFLHFKKVLKQHHFNRVICVDISNLFFCSLLNIKVDFLSFEICKDNYLLSLIKKENINCVIIQSMQRYEYLFKDYAIKTFFIQNAPVYFEIESKKRQHCLIYSGAANDSFAFFHCLNYLVKFPDEKMVLQGALMPNDRLVVEKRYAQLLSQKRLILNLTYLENNKVVEFISDYEIGFCFYNFDNQYVKENSFNYISAPSGKMFKYLAAGVPVVCSNIIGFDFVKDFKCGIQINSLDEDSIREAVLEIRKDISYYSENAKTAARHFSFDKAVIPYLHYIAALQEGNNTQVI